MLAVHETNLIKEHYMKSLVKYLLVLLSITALAGARNAQAASVDDDARAALAALYAKSPAAKALGEKAKGILVFPRIGKVAVLVGAQAGHGAMFTGSEIAGHYRVDGVLVGLEAGGQSYAYAMFLMSDKALETLRKRHGFEIGTDPNIVVVDAGAAKQVSTTTAQADVYGYVFNQSGLMGGVALQGLKITEVAR